MARSDWLGEPPNACIDFPLRARRDYDSRCRRRLVLVLLGLSATAALDVERDGAPADSILAMVREAAKTAGKKPKADRTWNVRASPVFLSKPLMRQTVNTLWNICP
jgi:hypothetical protein